MSDTEAPKNPGGRPTTYTEEIASYICQCISQGMTIREITEQDQMPVPSTIFLWLSKHPSFSDNYAKAQSDRTNLLAEEILDIADNGTNDWMERHGQDNEGWITNGEALQRSRLRVDTRKWLMAKMAPKKYGDSNTTTVQNPDGSNLMDPLAAVLLEVNGKTRSV